MSIFQTFLDLEHQFSKFNNFLWVHMLIFRQKSFQFCIPHVKTRRPVLPYSRSMKVWKILILKRYLNILCFSLFFCFNFILEFVYICLHLFVRNLSRKQIAYTTFSFSLFDIFPTIVHVLMFYMWPCIDKYPIMYVVFLKD